MRESRYNQIDTNFMEFAENRGASFSMQFAQIWLWNLKFLYRTRSSFYGLVFSTAFATFLNISIYWNIGYMPDLLDILNHDHPNDPDAGLKESYKIFRRYIEDITGFAFLFSN